MKTFRPIMTLAVSLVFTSVALLNGCSCHRDSTDSAKTPPLGNQSSQGAHPALQFDYKKTSEILIVKADPNSGDRWAARIQRDGIPTPENEELWTIQMGPDSLDAGDRKAHGGFILHLLDTIRTLQVKEAPVSGTPESFGLATPLFSLRWRVSEPRSSTTASTAPASAGAPKTLQAQVFKEYEVRVGGPVKGEDGSFQGLYASFGGAPGRVFIVQGALLRMLDMISSFQTLRLPTVLTISSDDVDELEVRRARAKASFYAQRESSRWVDAKHQPVPVDLDAVLEQATHLRVLRFIDNADELIKTDALITKSPATELVFKDRHGAARTLKLYSLSNGQKVYATFSTRKRRGSESLAIFEVYPDFMKTIKPL